MPVLLPAAAPGHHDSEPGPHRLDYKGHELLSGECINRRVNIYHELRTELKQHRKCTLIL
ncbi:hypothetical protein LDENG_00174750 [Lucifuga dentata]|nr:hypothetical protein LDENG_00174750 [Lucifuga dentata]